MKSLLSFTSRLKRSHKNVLKSFICLAASRVAEFPKNTSEQCKTLKQLFSETDELNLTNLEYLSETWNNLTQSNQGSETKLIKLINHSQQLHCTTAPCSYHEQTQRGTNWEAQSRRYLLMLLPSLSLSPSAPLLLALSLPAKSTRLSLLTFSPIDCKTSKLC